MKGIQIHQGDCLELLKKLDDESVDLLCCDPPYALTSVNPQTPGGGSGKSGFMGKKWDAAVPAIEVWQECLRVMKPGAFGFILCSPRQDCLARMIVNLEDAGFVTGFTSLYWVTASGFPKAANLGKAVDKRAGAEREVVGTEDYAGREGWKSEVAPGESVVPFGFQGNKHLKRQVTVPATPEAKALSGAYAGWQPKPAVEACLVVMRPLSEKTYLDQALDNGKGCTWLDDGRIPSVAPVQAGAGKGERFGKNKEQRVYECGAGREYQNNGRFPANLLVEDDVLNDGRVRATGNLTGNKVGLGDGRCYGTSKDRECWHSGDSGSYSRYFDLDAWHAKAMEALPERIRRVFPFLLVPKAAVKEKNRGVEGKPKKRKPQMGEFKTNPGRTTPKSSPTPRPNHHPTVKPQKLMQYLVTIGSRKGDVVLDPYCGSGTTGVACMLIGRQFIGMELDPEYVEITKDRIFGCLGPLFAKVAREESEE